MKSRNIFGILFVAILVLAFGQPAYAQVPDPEPVAQVEQQEPFELPVFDSDPVTLADAFAALMTAITAGGSHSITVAAADENLMTAQAALDAAEAQQAAAMDGQAEVEAGVFEAAQALVDHLRATFGVN